MKPDADARSIRAPLALGGAGLMLLLAVRELPPPREWIQRPATPLARSKVEWSGAEYRLLTEASRVIPPGATVLVRVGTDEAWRTDLSYKFAVALLPGRTVLPATAGGQPIPPELARTAEFVVLVGGRAEDRPLETILTTPDGAVWRSSR